MNKKWRCTEKDTHLLRWRMAVLIPWRRQCVGISVDGKVEIVAIRFDGQAVKVTSHVVEEVGNAKVEDDVFVLGEIHTAMCALLRSEPVVRLPTSPPPTVQVLFSSVRDGRRSTC